MLRQASDILAIDGDRTSGNDIRNENVQACQTIQNIMKTSFGPQGLDKMLVDEVGDVTVTNDGATILNLIEVNHPAAKTLVELAQTQDEAVGDGTTSVVLLAAELLKQAQELIKEKIHPTNIISGYKLATRKAIEFLKSDLQISTGSLDTNALINVAKTSMSSKILGPESDFFAPLCVNALLAVKVTSGGKDRYPIKAINILKQHGKSMKESASVNGFALNNTRAAQGMPKVIKKAKIALLDIALNRQKMKLGVKVQITDPKELEAIQEREQTLIRDRIKLVLDTGANVILTTKGIDDMCLKYFVEAGAIAVRRCDKEDLKRIAKLTGGNLVTSFADLEGGESFSAENLGEAEEVAEEALADDNLIYIRGCKLTSSQSLILRGANSFLLDEMSRTIHDALCALKRVLESKFVVPGGGAVETALSVHLDRFAMTIETREQLAIAAFANALLVIPKTLAVNAALDATELVAKLRAYHNDAYEQKNKEYFRYGLDLIDGNVRNNSEAGVLEPAMLKTKYLQFATEAAITILRIDDMIRINEKEEQDPRRR
ncbi:hypothetical protein ABK040_012676 [Willaertia magna]